MNKTIVNSIIFGGLAFALIAGFYLYGQNQNEGIQEEKDAKKAPITSFEECVAAGNPILESYPEQCKAGEVFFVRDIGNELEKNHLIVSESVRPGAVVTSPLTLTGQARGYWFFEASFPVSIEDAKGIVLGQYYVEAQDEWMTEEFVPYQGVLEFETPSTPTGTLKLHRDNPSGLPEHDDVLTIPVRFE